MKRVLLISHLFPPTGGSGVQRNVKYAKFLPHYGYTPHVLTTKEILYHSYDESLLEELPDCVKVHQTGSLCVYRTSYLLKRLLTRRGKSGRKDGQATFGDVPTPIQAFYKQIRGYVLFPDSSIGWLPFAIARGIRIIRKEKIDILLGSVGPYTSALVAYTLSKLTGVPYMLDFRDGWTDDIYLPCPTRMHMHAHKLLERITLSSAGAIGVFGQVQADLFNRRYPKLEGKVSVLTNGFDAEDFPSRSPSPSPARETVRTVVYCGSLYEHHEEILLKLLKAFSLLGGEIKDKLRLKFVGRIAVPSYQAAISELNLENHVSETGYVSHGVALEHLAAADATLLLLKHGDFTSYTGKVFEYIGMGKPIICVAERGSALHSLMRDVEQEKWYLDVDFLPEQFESAVRSLSEQNWPEISYNQRAPYSRQAITRSLSEILDSVVERHIEHRMV